VALRELWAAPSAISARPIADFLAKARHTFGGDGHDWVDSETDSQGGEPAARPVARAASD